MAPRKAAPPVLFAAPTTAQITDQPGDALNPFGAATPKVDPSAEVRMPTEWQADRALSGAARSIRAIRAREPIVKDLFAKADVAYPPAELAFVVYKADRQLEVWGTAEKGGESKRVATYRWCYASGDLGPKRYEGDRQVPEGFYTIQYGWAESAYHLEMKVSYPNMVDKVLGPKNRPLGGEIMIHGDCASIGCISMGDERDEELWTMMKAMGRTQVAVHIYPSRDIDALLRDSKYEQHHAFWKNLKEGQDRMKKDHKIPTAHADWRGLYLFD
ncbi:MAG: L,D-transpeptidase family protein [Polyangiaceae bacterium]